MKKIIIALSFLFLSACGGGDSDSGGSQGTNTAPGDNLPANFIGTYNGTLEGTATALGLTLSESFPITVTVNSDGTIDFAVEDETFSAGIANDGSFSVSIDANDIREECTGSINVMGSVDGTTATGSGEAEGQCEVEGVVVDAEINAEFTATM